MNLNSIKTLFQIKATNSAKQIMDTIKKRIDTADKFLESYDRLKDRVIPWNEFNETLVELDKYRKDYSIESATLIGGIKTTMMNGMDAYFSASQNVYEWAGVATPLLNIYIKLFNQHTEEKAQTQRTLLLKVLDDSIAKMTEARKELERSSACFNEAGGQLESLNIRFDAEFDEKSEFVKTKIFQVKMSAYTSGALFGTPGVLLVKFYVLKKLIPPLMKKLKSIEKFYKDTKTKVDNAAENIEKIKATLKTEIKHIGDLKVQTENTKSYINVDEIPEMRDDVIKSVQSLITHCDAYRKRHNGKTD